MALDDFDKFTSILDSYKGKYDLQWKYEKKPSKNWNRLWEESVDNVIIPEFVEIYPGFKKPVENTQYKMEITPQNAFGTGHHATTYGVMTCMQDLNFKGRKVLDMGCGTGVLGILASKMGAQEVIFIDYNKKCVENTRENITLNELSRKCQVLHGSIEEIPHGVYDFTVANVYRDFLIQNATHFAKNSKVLIISGFKNTAAEEVKKNYQNRGMKVQREYEKTGWTTLLLNKS